MRGFFQKIDIAKNDCIVVRVYGIYNDMFSNFSRERDFTGMQVSGSLKAFVLLLLSRDKK